MKPLHIALLVSAGALGGALIMRVTQPPHVATPAPVVAQAQTPPPPVATVQEPAPPVVEKHPSPFVPPREAPKPGKSYTRVVAQDEAPPPPPPTPVQTRPVSPAPETVPPARPEPEHVTPPPAPPEPRKVTLDTGTLIPVRLVDGLSTERNHPGDSFMATLDKELVVDGFVIAERGARVEGRVVTSEPAGRIRGTASLAVDLTRLRLSDGQWVPLSTESFERHTQESRRSELEKVGAGAAVGAIIGAIAGGGKGAAIGAGAGGATGGGVAVATRDRVAALPSETRLSFRLSTPVTVTERR